MGAPDWNDPYGILPEAFKQRNADCDTVAEAIRRAEERPSTTEDRKRCPRCGRPDPIPKTGHDQPQKVNTEYRCTGWSCNYHFDKPADDTTIYMTDDRAEPFDWIKRDDQLDPEEREMGPLFAGLDEDRRIALAIRLYRPWEEAGPSIRDLDPLFPNSHYWVGERTREWKDGDHRDLVPDPTADEPAPSADEATPEEPAPNTEPPIDPSVAVARIGGDYDELVAERTESTDASSDGAAVADGGTGARRWAAYGSG